MAKVTDREREEARERDLKSSKMDAQQVPIEGECERAVPLEGDEGEGEDLGARDEWEWQRLTYPAGTVPGGDWRGEALAYVKKAIQNRAPQGVQTHPLGLNRTEAVVLPGPTWTHMGPMPLDNNAASSGYKYGLVTGRINAIGFSPLDPTTAYIGGPAGGLWKTNNCCGNGTAWTPLWDGPTFPVQAVGAITVDPVNPNVVYVGTGDSQVPSYDDFGNGLYRTMDAGATWQRLGADVFSPYTSWGPPASTCCPVAPDQDIKSIAIDPRNDNTIVVGASYGLFISYDAGATWTEYDVVDRNSAAYNTSGQRVSSILMDGNTNPSTMYVALGYPYSSSNRMGVIGGANGVYKALVPSSGAPAFALITTDANGWPAGTANGTVTSNVGRIELAWNAAHTRIYAQVQNYNINYTNALGTWTTGDGGATWTLLAGTADANYLNCRGRKTNEAQDWYNLFLGVDPLNDRTLYVGRVDLYKITVDPSYTSATIQDLSNVYTTSGCTAPSGYGTLHPDQHGFAFVPGTNPSTFLVGDDGGIYSGTGAVGGFTQLNSTVNTMEFYAGQLGFDFANTSGASTQWAMGGFQDNGSGSWDSSNPTMQWQARGNGGDGFFAAFDPLAASKTTGRFITEYTYGALSCSSAGAQGPYSSSCRPAYSSALGEVEDWSTPFIIDQWNCKDATCGNMVLGTNMVWASTGAGLSGTWTRTGTTPLTKGGSKDIISIDVAHSTPGSVIVGTNDGSIQWSNNVFTGANCTAATANTANFACTANGTATWVNLTGGNAILPNRVILGVAFAPDTELTFYAAVGGFNVNTPGTPGHIFMGVCPGGGCTPDSVQWVDKSANLPDIPFTSVAANPKQPNQVFVGSYLGFFYTDDITQNPPVWNRFQLGMPNTRINFLTTDRGPATSPKAGTTLAAFTYGRGLYVLGLDSQLCPDITMSPSSLPSGTVGLPYSATFSAAGGAAPYTYQLAGSLLTGFTFDPATATLSGASMSAVASTFSITTTDANGCFTSQKYTLTIAPYDISFSDDTARSSVCVNSHTGYWQFAVSTGPHAGVYSGSGIVSGTSGMMQITATAKSTYKFSLTYYPIRATASATLKASNWSAALSDRNTKDDPFICSGKGD